MRGVARPAERLGPVVMLLVVFMRRTIARMCGYVNGGGEMPISYHEPGCPGAPYSGQPTHDAPSPHGAADAPVWAV